MVNLTLIFLPAGFIINVTTMLPGSFVDAFSVSWAMFTNSYAFPPFLSDWETPSENCSGTGNSDHYCPNVDYTSMVYHTPKLTCVQGCFVSFPEKRC
jgi:hypothetical protein